MKYSVGARVRVRGLVTAAEHNGKNGGVVGVQGERYKVKIEGATSILAVKEVNLEGFSVEPLVFESFEEADDCAVCFNPMKKVKLDFRNLETSWFACCGQKVCFGCRTRLCKDVCPFCRQECSPSWEEEIERERQLAERGVAWGCFKMGYRYSHGVRVQKNYDAAFEFLLKAARKGYIPAWHRVANCYLYGVGVEKSVRQSTSACSNRQKKERLQPSDSARRKRLRWSSIRRSSSRPVEIPIIWQKLRSCVAPRTRGLSQSRSEDVHSALHRGISSSSSERLKKSARVLGPQSKNGLGLRHQTSTTNFKPNMSQMTFIFVEKNVYLLLVFSFHIVLSLSSSLMSPHRQRRCDCLALSFPPTSDNTFPRILFLFSKLKTLINCVMRYVGVQSSSCITVTIIMSSPFNILYYCAPLSLPTLLSI